jgi:hypothetical protein
VTDSPGETQHVALEAHSRSAPVAEASTGEFVTDLFGGDGESGR